jgi:hypothetical protein
MPQKHVGWRNLHSVTERLWNRNPDKFQRKSVLFRTVSFPLPYAETIILKLSIIPVKSQFPSRRGGSHFQGAEKYNFFAPLA